MVGELRAHRGTRFPGQAHDRRRRSGARTPRLSLHRHLQARRRTSPTITRRPPGHTLQQLRTDGQQDGVGAGCRRDAGSRVGNGEAPFTGAVNQGFAAVQPSTADSASVRWQDTLTVAVPEVSLPALSLTVPVTAWFAPSVLTVWFGPQLARPESPLCPQVRVRCPTSSKENEPVRTRAGRVRPFELVQPLLGLPLRVVRNRLAGHQHLDDGRAARVRQSTLQSVLELPIGAGPPSLAPEHL